MSGLMPGTPDYGQGATASTPAHAPAPVAPQNWLPMVQSPIYGDPSMLAFMRASGLSNEIAAADVARDTSATQRALGIATDDLGIRGEQERRGISNNQEDRGVFRSGQTLTRTAEQEGAQARQLGAMQDAAANRVSGLQSGLLAKIAANQQSAAEAGLTTGQSQYQQRRLAEEGLL